MNNIDVVKFVWAYMIEYGHITNGKWSYYGGDWERIDGYDYNKSVKREKEMRENIKTIGVDWSKTKEPDSSLESSFTDTFHDSADVETLLGTIILNNGKEYIVGVGNAERKFSEYSKLISELAKDRERVKNIFDE
jgi:hypothetical protein